MNIYRYWVELIYDCIILFLNGVYEKIEGSIDDVEVMFNVWFIKVVEGLKLLIIFFLILIIILFIVFYMLKDFFFIKKVIVYVMFKKWYKLGECFLLDVNELFGNYIRG